MESAFYLQQQEKKCLNPYQMDFYRSLIHRTSSESQINGNHSKLKSFFLEVRPVVKMAETEFVYIITRALFKFLARIARKGVRFS